jgi:hypothetical protein
MYPTRYTPPQTPSHKGDGSSNEFPSRGNVRLCGSADVEENGCRMQWREMFMELSECMYMKDRIHFAVINTHRSMSNIMLPSQNDC